MAQKMYTTAEQQAALQKFRTTSAKLDEQAAAFGPGLVQQQRIDANKEAHATGAWAGMDINSPDGYVQDPATMNDARNALAAQQTAASAEVTQAIRVRDENLRPRGRASTIFAGLLDSTDKPQLARKTLLAS